MLGNNDFLNYKLLKDVTVSYIDVYLYGLHVSGYYKGNYTFELIPDRARDISGKEQDRARDNSCYMTS